MFDDGDLDAMLDDTGTPCQILLGGAVVKTIMVKYRSDAQTVDPFTATVTEVTPAILCKTSDLAGLDKNATFYVTGKEYARKYAPQQRNDGLTHILLAAR